jgi:recombination protein RecR
LALYEGPVQALIDELGRLPGVGPKSAQRIAFYLLRVDPVDAHRLATAIVDAKERVTWCRQCFNISEGELCAICRDERRETRSLCVVEEPRDIVAIERTGEFRGRYHVLQGAISPIEGVGPEQLRIKELLARIDQDGVDEIILATNPNIEGEATAMYLARLLKPLGMLVTRIASGLPVGGDLEYADEVTLGRAFEGRRDVER